MLKKQDTTNLGLVRKVKLRDFLLQAREKPMRRPSYDVLLARLTNQTEVVSWCPITTRSKFADPKLSLTCGV